MSIIQFPIAGSVAMVAAIGGVLLHTTLTQPAPEPMEQTGSEPAPTETRVGTKFPPVPVSIYTKQGRVGYCVMRVEYFRDGESNAEFEVAHARVTSELFIEFSMILDDAAEAPIECADRIGKSTPKYRIFSAEFYEQLE